MEKIRSREEIIRLLYNWFRSEGCPDFGEYGKEEINNDLNSAQIVPRTRFENTVLVLYDNNAFDIFNIDDNDKVSLIEIE